MLWRINLKTTVEFPNKLPVTVYHEGETEPDSLPFLGDDVAQMLDGIARELKQKNCPGRVTMVISCSPVGEGHPSVN